MMVRNSLQKLAVLALVASALGLAGCARDPSLAAIETDANGYVCMKCNAKLWTERKVFLESKCPKCGQDTLEPVVGFKCEKDQHLTIRPKVPGPAGAAVCEQCGTALKNAMVSPRESDLKVWGANKITATTSRTL